MTINDVARDAGVSRAAVSKVIRDAPGVSQAMRERVERSIAALDYTPSAAARAMRGASYRIGFEIPHVNARFMGQVVDGAKSVLAGTRYQLILAPADGPEYGAIEALADGLVDGIIAVPVCHPRVVGGSGTASAPRHARAARRARQLRLGGGGRRRRRPRRDAPPPRTRTPPDRARHRKRVRDYSRKRHSALHQAPGLPRLHDRRWPRPIHQNCAQGQGCGQRPPGDGEAVRGDSPPTAIFAAHDDLAMDALAGIADTGRHPGDVAVVGYDNTDVAAHPLISSLPLDQSSVKMGRTEPSRCCWNRSRA